MIKVNFDDGTTLTFDLQKSDDEKQWSEWSTVLDFQKKIRGIGVLHEGRFMTLPSPKGFKKVRYYAELVYSEKKGKGKRLLGEKVVCHADEIKHTLLVYTYKEPQPPPVLCRIDMFRIGKQMFPGVERPPKGRGKKHE